MLYTSSLQFSQSNGVSALAIDRLSNLLSMFASRGTFPRNGFKLILLPLFSSSADGKCLELAYYSWNRSTDVLLCLQTRSWSCISSSQHFSENPRPPKMPFEGHAIDFKIEFVPFWMPLKFVLIARFTGRLLMLLFGVLQCHCFSKMLLLSILINCCCAFSVV